MRHCKDCGKEVYGGGELCVSCYIKYLSQEERKSREVQDNDDSS